MIVPYTATSLDDAEAIIHSLKVSENDLRKQQVNGFYSDVELGPPGVDNNDELTKKKENFLEVKNQEDKNLSIQF